MKFRSGNFRNPFVYAIFVILVALNIDGWAQAIRSGDPDTSFGNFGNGLSWQGVMLFPSKILFQPDGKILTLGDYVYSDASFISRTHPNGTADHSFANYGLILFNQYPPIRFMTDMAIGADGKIVASGTIYNEVYEQSNGLAIWRFLPNGTPDPNFGSNGLLRTVIADSNDSIYSEKIGIQTDGKIVAIGRRSAPTGGQLSSVRYHPDGSIDGTYGLRSHPIGTGLDLVHEMRILSDNKLLLVGSAVVAGGSKVVIVKLDQSGNLDESFGEQGVAIAGPSIDWNRAAIRADGSCFVLSNLETISRFRPDGTRDLSFGMMGTVNLPTRLNAITIQRNGRIIVGGIRNDAWTMTRFLPNGSIDNTFGSGGQVTYVSGPGGTNTITTLAEQPDGRIVAGGYLTAHPWGAAIARFTNVGSPAPFDYDADGKTDVSLWRESNGTWYVGRSGSGDMYVQPWGLNGDTIVPADYDGDGKTDLAVRRPSDNNFYVFNSSNSTVEVRNFGIAGDIAVPSDYNGDGKADVSVWRPSNGTWYLSLSGSGIFYVMPWGLANDKPVPGDFDGDGKTELAVFRPSDGKWYTFSTVTGTIAVTEWGVNGDLPVHGDYNGDGRADFAVYRPTNNSWYTQNSNDGTVSIIQWGLPNDFPVPGDYDGDGKIDVAVWRPSDATWYVNRSGSGIFMQTFGLNGDTPTPSAFVF